MNLRQADIAQNLTRWLDRYSCPQHLREKPEAAQAEVEKIAGVLVKMAPQQDYQPFLNRVFDTLDYQMKTRAWPTVGEVGAVCSNIRKEAPQLAGPASEATSPLDIIAAKMERGEPVGEGWLYGRDAVELIRAGKVTREVMETYRSGAFLARRKVYGEDAALAWELHSKARHEAAKVVARGENGPRGFSAPMPDKREVPAA